MLNYELFKDTKIELQLLPHRPDADGPWQAKLTIAGNTFCTPARDPFTAVQSLLLRVYSYFDDRSEYPHPVTVAQRAQAQPYWDVIQTDVRGLSLAKQRKMVRRWLQALRRYIAPQQNPTKSDGSSST
jgi:hypothetical protein